MTRVDNRFNFWFNAFILLGMLAAVVVTNIYKLQQPDSRHFMLIFASVGALMGVVNTVLSANGNIWTFLFGVLDVSIASIVALDSSLRPGSDPVWGNFALHAFYFLPMQFVGWWQWRKRGARSQVKVHARRFTALSSMITVFSIIIGTVLTYLALIYISHEDNAFSTIRFLILFDALVLVLNIVGQILMSMAYVEQWYIWILVNIFSISLWSMKAGASPDTSYTIVMVIKYVFYLLNSINGLRIWYLLSANDR